MEKIKRLISWFDKTTEELKGERNIDNIKLDQLKAIFLPLDDDPFMIYPYSINEEEAVRLKELTKIDFDFTKYIYQLDCLRADE